MNCAESDVVRVFDDKLHLTTEEVFKILKQADLEKYGFEKTVEVSTVTDENGKITKKKTIYYKVTDDCSRTMFWESVLKQRLPRKMIGSKIFTTVQKEVESRIAGRQTKSCMVMLEVHPNKCLAKTPGIGMSKRGIWCVGCVACVGVRMNYDD